MSDAKERVRKVYPYADVVNEDFSYVWRIISDEQVLGTSLISERYAWEDAASKLPTPTAIPAHVTEGYWSHSGRDPIAYWKGRCSCGATWTTRERVQGCPADGGSK